MGYVDTAGDRLTLREHGSRGRALHGFTPEVIDQVLLRGTSQRTWPSSPLCPLGPREGGQRRPSLYLPSHQAYLVLPPPPPPPQRIITSPCIRLPQAVCMAKLSPWLQRHPQRSSSFSVSGPPAPASSPAKSAPLMVFFFPFPKRTKKSIHLPSARSEAMLLRPVVLPRVQVTE